MMEGDDFASNTRRSGRSRTASSKVVAIPRSVHPADATVDAAEFDLSRLQLLLEFPLFAERVDFLDMPDSSIKKMFVTSRMLRKAEGVDNLLFPPPNHRRTLAQIQKWFDLGNRQRRELFDESKIYQIEKSFNDDTLYWDGAAWRIRPPRIPSTILTCSGFTRQYMLSLSDTYYDQAGRERLELGLCQTIREAMSNRVESSRPSNHTWRHPSTVVGELWNMKDANDIRCIVDVGEHYSHENQFDFLAIRSKDCTRGAVEVGENLCKNCKSQWRYVKDKCVDNVVIRASLASGGFHPNTNRNILSRSTSLQKQHANYHMRTHRNKSKQILRMEKVAEEMIEQNGITVTRNRYSDAIFSEKNESERKVLKKLDTKFGPDRGCSADYCRLF